MTERERAFVVEGFMMALVAIENEVTDDLLRLASKVAARLGVTQEQLIDVHVEVGDALARKELS